MSTSLKNRSFNCRISFDEDGNPILGFIHGFYHIGENITDIRPVKTSTIVQIAKKLGIGVSSEVPAVKRKSPKKTETCIEQQSFENFL
jgi:hypothetical protein